MNSASQRSGVRRGARREIHAGRAAKRGMNIARPPASCWKYRFRNSAERLLGVTNTRSATSPGLDA